VWQQFFLGWQEAFLAGYAALFSFFIAFIVMVSVGESLNTISLFAFVLSLGLLVDLAIVIVEGTHNKVKKYKLTGYQAAISTVQEYAGLLFLRMITTVVAFIPLFFVQGVFGAFIKTIPVVVISTLVDGCIISAGGELQGMMDVCIDMFLKMILGIVLILFILVLQFNSYRQTTIIIFTIPLAMIGVFWGMTIFRMTLDSPAFIGIISLAGIVVNNAIILIDQINRELEKGMGLVEAAKEAGFVRFRPIILTTLTIIIGLLPLLITQPVWRNLGFAIIFGLSFSTLLTLVIVPTMFVSLYGKEHQVDEK